MSFYASSTSRDKPCLSLLLDGFIVNDFFESLSQDVNLVSLALEVREKRPGDDVFLASVKPRVILIYEAELNVTIEYPHRSYYSSIQSVIICSCT